MNLTNIHDGSLNTLVSSQGLTLQRSNLSLPNQVLAGYWFEWDRSDLSVFGHTRPEEVPAEYNMIIVAFMTSPTQGQIPTFRPDPSFLGEQGFIDWVNLWRSQGREVLISLGGAAGFTEVRADQREAFKNELRRIVNTYGFTGVDINLENRSITAADNQTVIPQVLNELKSEFNSQGRKFFITLAPEFPYLRSGGTYLPYVNNTNYDLMMPQYYNQGGDGPNNPTPPPWILANNDLARREDFIVALTQQMVSGSGMVRIPAEKLLIGLPSTEHAAYGWPPGVFYTDPTVIAASITRLRNLGINTRGVMTWSIPQDKEIINGRPSFDFGRRVGTFLGIQLDPNVTPPVQPPVTPPEGPEPPITPPTEGSLNPPTNLRITGQTQTSISLAWNPSNSSIAINRYEIFRNGTRIADVPGYVFTFTDNGLTAGTSHEYTVRANALSAHSNIATGTTSANVQEPTLQPPTNLREGARTHNSIRIDWNLPSVMTNIQGFRIFRNNQSLTTVGAGVTSFTDTQLAANTSFSYRVASFNHAGNEAASNTITLSTLQQPAEPGPSGGLTFGVEGEGTTRQTLIVTNRTGANIPTGWRINFTYTGSNPTLEWPANWAQGSGGTATSIINAALNNNGSVRIPMGVGANTRVTTLSVNGNAATRA